MSRTPDRPMAAIVSALAESNDLVCSGKCGTLLWIEKEIYFS